MSNSVSYNYVPNQNVYVINTLGPNNQYPYWGFPYNNYGGQFNSPGSYPNGFTSSTPAIQSGQVLQSRILFTTNNSTVPTIMYDIRVTGELGTTIFPENMIFPATPGTAGTQTVNFGGTLLIATPIVVNLNTPGTVTATYTAPLVPSSVISKPSAVYTATITVGAVPLNISIDLSTTTTVAAFITALNAQLGSLAVATLANGVIVITTTAKGSAATISAVDTNSPHNLFNNIEVSFVGFTTVAGTTNLASTTVYVDGAPNTVTIDLSTTTNIALFLAAFNAQLGSKAVLTLASGNLLLTGVSTGVTSTIVIVDTVTNPLFASLPSYVGMETSVPGVASGLNQAQAYYATLSL